MKIRNGFVSNSSSSSFLIVMKNNKILSKNSLIESFKVDKNSPLFGFADDLADFLIGESKECSIKEMHDNYIGSHEKDELTKDEMIDELVDEMSMDKDMLELLKDDKIKVYKGSACSDDDDPISSYIYHSSIDMYFDTEEISMKNLY